MSVLCAICLILRDLLRSRAALSRENLALRQRLAVLRRTTRRPKLRPRRSPDTRRADQEGRHPRTWRTFLRNHLRCTALSHARLKSSTGQVRHFSWIQRKMMRNVASN